MKSLPTAAALCLAAGAPQAKDIEMQSIYPGALPHQGGGRREVA